MILFKFTLKLIEMDSMKALIKFNWLLCNYQHNSIQNYIFNKFDTFLFSLIQSEFISPLDKFVISLRNDLAYTAYSFLNKSGKHQGFIRQYWIVTA